MTAPYKQYVYNHFAPEFYLKSWIGNKGILEYLKKDNGFYEGFKTHKSAKRIGGQNYLYWSRNEDKSVEQKFFNKIDSNASLAIKALRESQNGIISNKVKTGLTPFLNTLQNRTPQFIQELRNVPGKRVLKEGEYDDTAKLIAFYNSPEGFQGSIMGKVFKEDFDKIIESKWILYKFKKHCELITSGNPLIIGPCEESGWIGDSLPQKFYMYIPVSPHRLLLIQKDSIKMSNWFDNIKQGLLAQTINQSIIVNSFQHLYAKSMKTHKQITTTKSLRNRF